MQSKDAPKRGLGARIRGTLGDVDPLNRVPFKNAKSRPLLRELPNTTHEGSVLQCCICSFV